MNDVRLKGFEFVGTDAKVYAFRPECPFRARGILTWYPHGALLSFMVGKSEQLVEAISLELFKSPFTVQQAWELIKTNRLEHCLPTHLKGLMLPTAATGQVVTLTTSASDPFLRTIVWGIECVQKETSS
jgi:hypothetical protein